MTTTVETLPTSVVDELCRSPIVRALVAQLPVGIIVASPNGELEHVNEVARSLCEKHRLPHAPRDPWLATKPEGELLEPIRWIIGRVLLTGELVRDEEVEFLDSHDEWRTLSVCATPVRTTDGGEIAHAVVTFADVTGRNQARAWEPLIRSLCRL